MGRLSRGVYKPGEYENGVYLHVYNHCVENRAGDYPLGDVEKEKFFKHLQKTLQLFNIECLGMALMSNHFHLILYVPKEPLSFEAMAQRIKKASLQRMYDENCQHYVERRAEMSNDLSAFMKELQQGFTCWFNRTRDFERRGTLWEQRFKCTKLADASALATCLLYVELNGVRAGIVADPAYYRFCTYGIWQQSGRHPFAKSFEKHMGYAFFLNEKEQNIAGIEAHMRSRFAAIIAYETGGDMADIDKAAEKARNRKSGASLLRKSRFWIDSVVLGGKIAMKEQATVILGPDRAEKRRFNAIFDDGMSKILSLRRLAD